MDVQAKKTENIWTLQFYVPLKQEQRIPIYPRLSNVGIKYVILQLHPPHRWHTGKV